MQKSIVKNSIFKFALSLFNIVVPILVNTYIYRIMDESLVGAVNFSQTIYGFFFIFASFGVYQYGLREISRVRDDKEKLSKVFSNLFVITIISNTVTTLLYILFIFRYRGTPDVYTACMVLTFMLFSNVFYVEWLNEGLENFDFITIKTIIIKIIYIVLLFVFVKSSANFFEYMVLLALSTIANNVVSFIYVKRLVRFDFKSIKILPHLKPMLLVVILSNANVLYTQFDRFVLGELVNLDEVSYYSMAQNIASMINTLILTIIYVSVPRLSNYLANKKDKDFSFLFNKMTNIFFFLLFPSSIGILLLSREITILYGTEKFMPAVPMLVLFSIYNIFVGYDVALSNQVMYLKHREKQQVKIIFIGGAINVVLTMFLNAFGILDGTTAIMSTIIAEGFVAIALCYYVNKHLKIYFNPIAWDKIKYLLVSLVFFPAIYLVKSYVSNIFLICIASIPLCGILYFAILFVMKDPLLLEFLDFGLKKLKRGK